MISCFYVEGAGYQENILPRKHKQLGYDVSIISKSIFYDNNKKTIRREPSTYYNKDGIQVTILDNAKKHFWSNISRSRLAFFDRVTEGLYDTLEAEKPDIIFEHGLSVKDTEDIVRFVKNHSQVKLFIDQHGDYYNTPIKSKSIIENILLFLRHRVYHRIVAKKSMPYVDCFWGTTPWRVQFLKEVYGVEEKKCDLLVMGGDESYIHWNDRFNIRKEKRKQLGINEKDFVIITGGKIDKAKNVHLLVEAIQKLQSCCVKLLLFGVQTDDMKDYFHSMKDTFIDLGWLDSNDVYDWFLAADLAVFPGTHSVLWEQAAACGIPLICKFWEGMQHINVSNNCRFLLEDSSVAIKNELGILIGNKSFYNEMKKCAEDIHESFYYINIAKKAIKL